MSTGPGRFGESVVYGATVGGIGLPRFGEAVVVRAVKEGTASSAAFGTVELVDTEWSVASGALTMIPIAI